MFNGLRLSVVVAAEALAELTAEVLAELTTEVLADILIELAAGGLRCRL